MIPFIEQEIICRGWLTAKEFVEIVGIAEMTPGPVAINSATFVGYRLGGFLGAAISTLGVVLPSFLIIYALFYFYIRLQKRGVFSALLRGIRPAVIVLIIAAAFYIGRNTVQDLRTGGIFLLVLIGSLIFKKMHPLYLIMGAGILGIITSFI